MAHEERETPPCSSAWQIGGRRCWTEERESRGAGRGSSESIYLTDKQTNKPEGWMMGV